jgi:hypothetical protein
MQLLCEAMQRPCTADQFQGVRAAPYQERLDTAVNAAVIKRKEWNIVSKEYSCAKIVISLKSAA